jgi:hypothetical protein
VCKIGILRIGVIFCRDACIGGGDAGGVAVLFSKAVRYHLRAALFFLCMHFGEFGTMRAYHGLTKAIGVAIVNLCVAFGTPINGAGWS